MKNLILATASVLALSVAGPGSVYAADDPGTTAASPLTPNVGTPVNLSESQIRQVQQRLKTAGFTMVRSTVGWVRVCRWRSRHSRS